MLASATALLATAALLFASSTVAYADDNPDARSSDEIRARKRARNHFERGQKHFALRRFERALAQYEAAFEAEPLPDFLFNIGQCHRNLGHYEEAIFSFRRYLKLKPDAVDRVRVKKLIQKLENERDKAAHRRTLPLVPGPDPGPQETTKPLYKKWWFWAGVAVVAAAGTTVMLLNTQSSGLPDTDLGNVDFP